MINLTNPQHFTFLELELGRLWRRLGGIRDAEAAEYPNYLRQGVGNFVKPLEL
jgi:hypothetical protein